MNSELKVVCNTLQQIREAKGKQKQLILEQHKDNEILKEVLEYCYNPHKVYGIKKTSWNKVNLRRDSVSTVVGFIEFIDFKKQLNHLQKTNVNKALLEEINLWANKLHPELKGLFKGILFKDLKLGINTSTINKVWSNLIPTHRVERLSDYDIATGQLPFRECMVSRKWDGLNCTVLKEHEEVKLLSREGKELNGLNMIKMFANSLDLDDYVYYGELVWSKNNKENFKTIIKCKSLEFQKKESKNIQLILFNKVKREIYYGKEASHKDYISIKEIDLDLYNEFKELYKIGAGTGLVYVLKMPQQYINTFEALQDLFLLATKENWEGLVIKDANGYFSTSRGKYGRRLKSMKTEEFEIVGFEEGIGRLKDTLGSLVVRLDDKNIVKVGTGFNDKERKYIWKNQEKIRPLLATVAYFQQSISEKGSKSLRFPVFKGLRIKGNLEEVNLEDLYEY